MCDGHGPCFSITQDFHAQDMSNFAFTPALYLDSIWAHNVSMTSAVVNTSRSSTQMKMKHLPYLRMNRAGPLWLRTKSRSCNKLTSTLCHSRVACLRPYRAFFSFHTAHCCHPAHRVEQHTQYHTTCHSGMHTLYIKMHRLQVLACTYHQQTPQRCVVPHRRPSLMKI